MMECYSNKQEEIYILNSMDMTDIAFLSLVQQSNLQLTPDRIYLSSQ